MKPWVWSSAPRESTKAENRWGSMIGDVVLWSLSLSLSLCFAQSLLSPPLYFFVLALLFLSDGCRDLMRKSYCRAVPLAQFSFCTFRERERDQRWSHHPWSFLDFFLWCSHMAKHALDPLNYFPASLMIYILEGESHEKNHWNNKRDKVLFVFSNEMCLTLVLNAFASDSHGSFIIDWGLRI